MEWIGGRFAEWYPCDLRLPYLFPIPNGQVRAEWSLGSWSLSLDFDSIAKRGVWHALNVDTDEEAERDVDLASADGWTWISEQVRSASRVAE
jgi:hypothetical protein